MESIVGGLAAIVLLALGSIAAIVAAIVYKARYKIAGADEALVITGSKKKPMQVLPGVAPSFLLRGSGGYSLSVS